jgi:hypothetical protein
VALDDLVEAREMLMELLHQRRRLRALSQAREAGEVREHDRGEVVVPRLDRAVGLQLCRDGRREEGPQQLVRALALGGHRRARLLEIAQQRIALEQLAPKLQLRHGRVRQAAHRFALRGRDLMGLEVDDAEAAEREALAVDQRHAAVEADVRFTDDVGIFLEALVLGDVWNVQRVILADRRRAHDHIARRLGRGSGQAVFGLEPVARLVDEAEDRHRASADLRGDLGERVVFELGRGIEHAVFLQRCDALDVVRRYGSTGEHAALHASVAGRPDAMATGRDFSKSIILECVVMVKSGAAPIID